MQRFRMKNRVYAIMTMAVVTGVSIAASAQEGPRSSSYGNWPGMLNSPVAAAAAPVASIEPPAPAMPVWQEGASPYYTPAAPVYNPSFEGPRPSSAH